MAEALGWPDTPIGWKDILALSQSEGGWADHGHPEWGEFRLGKTNPNFSTSGLSALIAQTYAATGKTSGLSAEDLANPTVVQYGNRHRVLGRALRRHHDDVPEQLVPSGSSAAPRSPTRRAVAVEEKSLIDYNKGNPDGVLSPGEEPRPPRIPLVAIYPTEGTLYSDNPLLRPRRPLGHPGAA